MKKFKRILVFAGTEEPQVAINRAVELALENRASLTFMDVIKPMPKAIGLMTDVAEPKDLQGLVVQDHKRKLLDIASEYADTGLGIDVAVSVGDPATEIVRRVLDEDHDLVVKSADGTSIAGRIFGSTARSLLRICPCPLWLLKPAIHGPFDRVLVAIDAEASDKTHQELNDRLLELSHSIAIRDRAELHVVAAWQLWMESALRRRAGDSEIDAALASYETNVRATINSLLTDHSNEFLDVKMHLHRGPAASVIRSVADAMEADLLVMGTVCRSGAAGFLIGNTAETVLSEITCSLLTVKPEGFVTPVQISDLVLTESDEELPQI